MMSPRDLLLAAALGAGGAACAEPAGLNFLLISLDTVRPDRLGTRDAQGHPRTPALDALADQSLVFSRAFAQANETLFSHASLFTGSYPSEIGPLDYASFRLPRDAPTLAAQLARAGYRTEAVVAGGHMNVAFGMDAGFQRFASMHDFGNFQQTVPHALERLALLRDEPRPFLMLVHGYDAHTPYVKPGPLLKLESPGYQGELTALARDPMFYESVCDDRYYPGFEPAILVGPDGTPFPSPSDYEELRAYALDHPEEGVPLSSEDLDFLRGTYDAALSLADYQVGVLLEELEALDLAANTVVLAFSDHGEDLLDHGFFNHRVSLHDSNTAVVLMLRGPGIEPGLSQAPVALTDVLPTLLELAGLQAAAGRGRSLLAEPDPQRAIYSESALGQKSVRTADGRLIMPRDARLPAGPPPEAPPLSWLDDDQRSRLDWGHPLTADLWQALLEASP